MEFIPKLWNYVLPFTGPILILFAGIYIGYKIGYKRAEKDAEMFARSRFSTLIMTKLGFLAIYLSGKEESKKQIRGVLEIEFLDSFDKETGLFIDFQFLPDIQKARRIEAKNIN